jgi:hypothetical protein
MSNNEPQNLSFEEITEVSRDYKLLQARNSKNYVAFMVDICVAINNCPMGKLKNLDVEEVKSQTGHLIYFEIKSLAEPIPCDVAYVPQLNSHFRKPTIIVLRRVQKYLIGEHRRILGRLEREQALERIIDSSEFDVSQKIRSSLDEMNRLQSMARMVRGGGRRLDILMQALHVPNRARFELITVDRIFRDPHHQRHREAITWLSKSKFRGNPDAVQGVIKNGFQMLDAAANKILDSVENLTGLKFPRESGGIDLGRNWYALGQTLPRGEEFLKTFTAEDLVEREIKRLTYPMVRLGWDAERLSASKDKILVDLNVPKIQAAKLANLILELEKKIASSTKPDGEVMVAIEADFNNGMLSKRERQDAERWARDNKIKLQELIMETYDNLKELKENNKDIALPEKLEAVVEKIKAGLADDVDAHKQSVADEIGKLTIQDLADLSKSLEDRLGQPDAALLQDLGKARQQIIQRINHISINNIDFHKSVRDAFKDMSEYEDKVMELYGMEEALEAMRINCERWLVDCYRVISYEDVSDKLLAQCIEVVIQSMMLGLKKLDYKVIDAAVFESYLEEALKLEGRDGMAHLDQLLQEVQAVPSSEQLLNALKDWEKDLGKDATREKETFIMDNGDTLQALTDRIRAELRERVNASGGKGLSRRLRFEVFGLSDCLAESLSALVKGLLNAAETIANEMEGEQLVKNLMSLEAQVIEAQKTTKMDGNANQRLTQMAEKQHLTPSLVQEMEQDLKLNFKDLDKVLEEVSVAMKRVRMIQNKFGAKKEVEYLDVTINIHDIEKLKNTYDFIDGVTIEDTKRFCVAYNLKAGLISNIFERARKKDLTLPKEILQQVNRKTHKLFSERRFIPLPLKTAIFKNSKDVFEAECQLLCHTLNLVKPFDIRKKASYIGIMNMLAQAQSGDPQIVKAMGLMWGRIQTRLFHFKPLNHGKNFEGNRQAMMTDVQQSFGKFLKR